MSEHPPGAAFERGRRFLVGEAAAGFPEAMHRMTFPHAAGFTGASELQSGDVFSRAILGGLLLNLADAAGGDAELQALAAEQAEHVAAQKLSDCAGGWSYFPGLPELPPDLDTLAAAIALFARTAPQHLALCRRPIEIALAQRAADGSIPTFLISDDDQPARLQAMRRGVTLYWGNTADADVLARFYRSLLRLDAAAYAPLAPLEWLAGLQQPDGDWVIPWYAGRHYGTHLCAELFDAIAPDAPAARAARAFLSRPDAAASALDIAVSSGDRQALFELQAEDGSWPASPWIQMPIGRPGGRIVRTLRWQSRSITTAYCLRAIQA